MTDKPTKRSEMDLIATPYRFISVERWHVDENGDSRVGWIFFSTIPAIVKPLLLFLSLFKWVFRKWQIYV